MRRGPPLPLLLLAAAFLVAPLVLPSFYITLANYIGLASIVALGLVLITGIGGLTSFGQAAFVGLGAYTTGFLTTAYGLSPWLTLPIGLALTAVVTLPLGLITLRLSGHYLPIGTIAWSISLYYLFANLEGLGGYNGMSGVPPLAIGGHELNSGADFYYLIWSVMAAALATVHNLLDSRPGRAVRSLRGGGVMAESFGIDTAAVKLVIFLYAGLLAALSGWLYAHFMRYVNPTPFGLNASIEYLFMAVAGGASSIWGAIVGAGLLTLLKYWLQDLIPKLIGRTGQFEIIVFGILMVLLFQHARQGVVPLVARRYLKPRRVSVPRQAAPLAMHASYESVDFERYGGRARYCAHARYGRLYQWVMANEGRVALLDADSLVRGDLVAATQGLGDIALVYAVDEPIWHRVLSGFSTYRPSAQSRRFLGRMAGLAALNLTGGRARYSLDQTALYVCATLARADGTPIDTLPLEYCDTTFQDHSLVWSVTQSKQLAGRFQELKSRILQRDGEEGLVLSGQR